MLKPSIPGGSWQRIIAGILAIIMTYAMVLPTSAQEAYQAQSNPGPRSLAHVVNVPGGEKLVSVEAANANIRELLRDMANQGGFNLILDPSVTGTITLELQNVSINHALSAITALAGIEILPRSENIYLAISKETATEKGLNRALTKMIKINYGNATQIAALLNTSLFAVENAALSSLGGSGGGAAGGGIGGGGSAGIGTIQKVKADPRTNSLIIIGSQRDIDLTEEAVAELDRPRDSKTFYLSYANAVDVASQLTSSVFNDGTQGLIFQNAAGGGGGGAGGGGSGGGMGAGSGGGGAGGGGLQSQQGPMQLPSTVRVQLEEIAEGQGANTIASGNGSSSTFSEDIVLRGSVKTTESVLVSPLGPIVVPDTRLNAVTVMGTAEQISVAERIIPILDAEPPQVSIEVSMVEITDEGVKEMGSRIGIADGRLQLGFNNEALSGLQQQAGIVTPAGTGLIGLPTNDPTDSQSFARSGGLFSTNPAVDAPNYLTQIEALVNNRRAKILANPTVVATHDTEAVISMVDEIIRRVTITVDGQTGTTTVETEIGEAGIVLDILPKIGEDNTISMRIRPSITTIRNVVTDAQGNITTLLTKRDVLAQSVRIKDGETLVLGGLIQDSRTNRSDKLPLLGDLPIVGALFRASTVSQERSEIVILLTPHIINKTRTTPPNYLSPLAKAP